ncbi:PAS domain S-box-containing protein [Natronorubrum sediminis]|uniref:histidine kinase n=1 Tax=Natronorubrum sediminis TaxID=640943 RepID=A0A1H6FSK5_9EURY|nr:PAS domain-containing protein [Natronorubrum sediminis]SEH12744.1 PAS domain S-box-containing protein [Natronorubrum sediminis]
MAASNPPPGQLRSRIRQQEVVAELSQLALESTELESLLAAATSATRDILDVAYCGVLESRNGGETMVMRADEGWRNGVVGTEVGPLDSDTVVGTALETDMAVIVDDIDAADTVMQSSLSVAHDAVGGVGVSIESDGGPWGVFVVYTAEHREFADHDVAFLEDVASLLASAVQNRRQHQRLETELETTVDRISDAVVGLDTEWQFTYANDRARELLDCEDADLHGTNFWEAFPETIDSTFGQEYRRAMETQESTAFEEYYPPLETWFEVNVYPSETGLSIYFRDITSRKQTERELQRTNQTLQQLYAITADRERTFEEKVQELLDIGRERLGLEVGFMADIEPQNDRFEVVHSSGDDERLRPGTVTELSETYCRKTVDSDELLVLTNAPVQGWTDDRAYDRWDFDSYLGSRIHVDDDLFGTLCFADEDPRSVAFTPAERGFVELLTQWLSYELERQQRKRELEVSEQRYRTLIEHFPNGMVALFDDDLRYTLAGGGVLEDLDVSIETLVGQTVEERYEGETREAFESNFRAVLSGERRRFEYHLHGRVWLAYALPVEDDDGTVFAGMVMVQDVTARKEQEEKLREREAHLERFKAYTDDILDAIDDVFYVVDEDGSFQRWNETLCHVTGYTDEEIASMTPMDVFDQDDHEQMIEVIGTAFETGYARAETNLVTKSGETIPYEFIASTLEDPSGEPVLTGVGRDISDRRADERRREELVDELESSNERLEQFAYAASHDLQEPLRMVTSYLTLLEHRYAEELDEDADEFIEYAVDGASRMQEMIDGLLAYSRVDTQGNPFEVVDCEVILEDVVTDLEVRIEETGAAITIESLPSVYGDPGQLRQVFQNLLDNALTYSGEQSPQIAVFAERDGHEWHISVRDHGIGIDPDNADRIFQVFDRLHSVDEYAGTGIGLALCQRIVERHDGDIRVVSEPGEGARFTVTLPAPPETASTTTPVSK